MKIKMSPVANEMSIKWILWTRFHHFLRNANLKLVAGGLEWPVEPQNSRIPRTVLTENETHEKSRTGNDEIEYIAEEIGTFGLVHRSRREDQLQISSTAIEMSIFY